jgi:exosortase/archaeosortase family protein
VDKALFGLVLRFALYLGVMFAGLVWLGARTHVVANIENATASVAAALMSWTGVVATSSGHFIQLPARRLLIGPDCVGIRIAALVVAAVAAYPVRVTSRVLGVVGGVGAVLAANLVRLVVVAHLGGAPDAVFFAAHDFLFQVGMAGVAVAVWAGWLSYARARER